ncbi:MAG TPA: carboxypeptidase regulatory-like domain-containing protein [Archangium sp.]|uniref:carboxypeptidase regulatory-like domain-containing protein n=1 Tax=Archangium sp. TaxID=1872627 RepID=UPI002E335A04|nr:carboxypeptidase regulatory-like domain-containing protein [Archangium sp.]HEX5749558.1 carboxypeptidase regulatory-like domain-containing protein [Archangium sp.]
MKHAFLAVRPTARLLAIFLSLAVLLQACKPDTPAEDPPPPPPAPARTAWVFLRQQADLSPAFGMKDWNARGRFVVEQLQSVARSSQGDLRDQLRAHGLDHQSFWLVNAVRVKADDAALKALASRPDVDHILQEGDYRIPTPIPGTRSPPTPSDIEWNIARIRAPEVWSTFGTRGEGIVIGSIDTGVQFDHPALARQYRGRLADGSLDHNYNWFDPSSVCGSPSLAPCDNVGHGTHTMGTMAGDDDSGNQIGVAPGARWISAKGCEDLGCSTGALLAAGQWMLAPTDLSGNNPRPELRPHILNNSWGDGPSDPFFRPIVQAWVAAGIFPTFAVGNPDPAPCGSVGVPAAYPESYGVGAFDINGNIASFSARGPSAFDGLTKPDIAAPGVNVRSSFTGGGYEVLSGTSMATPHVAATVALMWSAAPSLVGDVEATRALLDASAVDREDLSCGGTAADNNVWGEGQLDAFAAVERAPTGPTGIVRGVVTDASTGAPLPGARVLAEGPFSRDTLTDEEGRYSLTLPTGTYRVSATFFGYERRVVEAVEVTEGSVTPVDFALSPVPSHAVSGRVLDASGAPIAFARVTLLGTPLGTVLTDAAGAWRFERVPEGEYDVRVEADGCFLPRTEHLLVDGGESLDLVLESRTDAYGYSCRYEAPAYVEATTPLPLAGDDSVVQVGLPFPFTFYGQTYGSAYVSTNGNLNFLAPNANFANESLPSPNPPNAAIYALWDDLLVDGESSVLTLTRGEAPARELVVEWRNVAFLTDTSQRVDFEIILTERGQVLMQYRNLADTGLERGESATVGIENETGTVALQYSFNSPALRDERAIRFVLPPNGFVEGVVTDANDGLPIAGATVRALAGGTVVRQVTTGADGRYRLQLFLGTYTLEASAPNYVTGTDTVTLSTDGEGVTRDWVLRTARAVITPTVLEFIVPRGERRTQYLTLSNTGSAPLEWRLRETGGERASVVPRRRPTPGLKFDPNSHTTRDVFGGEPLPGWGPTLVGDVLRSWPTGLELPWGVGYTGNVWLSDPTSRSNHEFTVDGVDTGRDWLATWVGQWPADMAHDAGRGLMCQLDVGGDNGIHCWEPATGAVMDAITGDFPWTATSQRGLAYRPDDDTFYVGGWNEGIIYHVKGLSHPDRGAVIGQCSPADGSISGLAWNPSFNVLWMATNSPSDTLYELNPDTCTVLATLAHPNPGFSGAGLELNEQGNLWTVSQNSRQAYLIESGVPVFTDVPWLSESPDSGTLGVGLSQRIAVTADATGLEPGIYHATLYLQSNSGRAPTLQIPIVMIVPAYYQGVNAGDGTYVDRAGNVWAADQRYSRGSWGYVDPSRTVRTSSSISGTDDDPLYQTGRRGFFEYRFDGLPPGVYQIDLRFAEIQSEDRLERVFDVVGEQTLLLPAHDIAGEVGRRRADDHSFFLEVTDGQLNLRFVPREGYGDPLVNAVRVFQRPDR